MSSSPNLASESGLNRGAWTVQEDSILSEYIRIHGDGGWGALPKKAGLKRCGKSCRLRWLNYLRPDIKRGNISPDEEDLIIRLHRLLGNRWSLIAGRLPGRTDNEVKNYWNTRMSKRRLPEKKTLLKPTKPHKKFTAAPFEAELVSKATLVKATAVRIAKWRNKYVEVGTSDHQDLRPTGVAQSGKAIKSRCQSWVEDISAHRKSDFMDQTMAENIAESMQISNGHLPSYPINSDNQQFLQFSHPAEEEVNMSQMLVYLKEMPSSERDMLLSPCDLQRQMRNKDFVPEMGSSQSNAEQVKCFRDARDRGMGEIYSDTHQKGDWVPALQRLQKSKMQSLSMLLLESEEQWEERCSKVGLEDFPLFL